MRKRSLAFRSLLAVSLLSIMYTSLFFGSTLAWFVDSTGVTVNTFTMGNLNASVYRLEFDESGNVIARDEQRITSNTMLRFGQELGSSNHLFEPGVTFELPVLYVKNFSSFPINYKLRIERPEEVPVGDYADFYKVLKFYAKVGDKVEDLSTFEGKIPAANTESGVESERITIYVHMDEQAGNEYMNKQVSGIQIQFYLYQQEAAADAGVDAWNKAPESGYRLIPTDGSVTDVRTGR